MLYVVILGAVAFALLEKKPYRLFLSFYGFGCVYTYLNYLASNTGMMAVSMTLSVAGAAGMVLIGALLRELAAQYTDRKSVKHAAIVLLSAVLAIQLGTQIYTRLQRTYWDGALPELTETISCGAAKGLKTTPGNAELYQKRYENLTWLLQQTQTEGKRFLSCTSAPYLYLDADMDFATFSAWTFGYGGDYGLDERLLEYWTVNPDKLPDIIFCGSEEDILPFIDDGYRCISYNGAYLFVK